ncbi:MAG: DUF177 domain-containing protein [Endomicrobium sp.]|jgi:uncharacterized protein|nr:DUF177 domain-containing protein [Endomicrobium sp.]
MKELIIRLSDFLKKEIVEVKNFKYTKDIGCQANICVSFIAAKVSDFKIYIKGEVVGFIEQECSLCLEPYSFPLQIPINIDMDIREGCVDIGEEIRQLMILEMPLKPICKSDCLGICKVCGRHNKKDDSCSCVDEDDNVAKHIWKELLNKYQRK